MGTVDPYMAEFDRRRDRAEHLAERFADLPTDAYETFLQAMWDAGLDLDFVTSSMLFEELQRRKARKAQTPQ